jgi:hypothetical protein
LIIKNNGLSVEDCMRSKICVTNKIPVIPSGAVVIMLAIGTKVYRFKPHQEQWLLKGYKNPQYDFLRRGSKAVGPV